MQTTQEKKMLRYARCSNCHTKIIIPNEKEIDSCPRCKSKFLNYFGEKIENKKEVNNMSETITVKKKDIIRPTSPEVQDVLKYVEDLQIPDKQARKLVGYVYRELTNKIKGK